MYLDVKMKYQGPTRDALEVLAIAGSLRRGSHNRRLLTAAAALAPEGLRVRIYGDLASIPFFDEDLERASNGGPDAVRRLRHEVAAADGLLLATPEYEQSIPGVLKNVLDWLSRGAPERPLQGKPIAVTGATTGRWGTRMAQAALRQTLAASGALVLPGPSLFVSHAESVFDAAGGLEEPAPREQLIELLGSFQTWIETQKPRQALAQ